MGDKVNILLVDDESTFTEPIAFWMNSKGYDAVVAKGGEEAISIIKEKAPDIIFLDIHMPEMDGVEALEKIRSFNKTVPVIMVTAAYSNEEKISKCKELGISGFFAKNYTLEQLIQMIQVTLRTHSKLHPPSDKKG